MLLAQTLTPQLSVSAPAEVQEGNDAVYTITLSEAQATAVTVDYTLTPEGGADLAADLEAGTPTTGTVTIAAGATEATVAVPVALDAGSETGEGVKLTLSNVAGGDGVELGTDEAAVALIDKPVTYELTASSDVTREGQDITFTVTASLPVEADVPVSIRAIAADPMGPDAGSDKTNMDDFSQGFLSQYDVIIPQGQKSVSYTVTNLNDNLTEYDENFTVEATVNGTTYTKDIVLRDYVQTTFNFDTGNDNLQGSILDDTFTGNETNVAAADKVDGGAGVDTLTLSGDNTLVLPGTIENIEKINFTSSAALKGDALDVSNITGVDNLTVTFTNSNGDTTITAGKNTAVDAVVNANANDVTITGGSAVDVTINGNTAAKTLTAAKLETLTVKGTVSADLTVASAPKTLTMVADKAAVTGNNIVNATVETLTIEAAGKGASDLGTIKAAALENVTITGSQDLTVDLGDAGNTALKTVTSTATGDVTLDVDALPVNVTMGAGDDVVTATLATGQTLNGGDGVDSLSMTAAAADAVAAKITGVSNFEKLLVGNTTTTATAVDMQYFTGFTGLISAGTGAAGTLAVSNLANDGSFGLTAATNATGAVTLTMKDATGDNDTFHLDFEAADGFTASGSITVNDVENLNISTNATGASPSTVFAATVAANAAKSIHVEGNMGLTLTNTDTTVTTFDASGVTGKAANGAVTWTTGALAAEATITGGAGNDVIDASAAVTKAVTLSGGAGDDTLTAGSKGSTIDGGAGDDTLTGGAGKDVINGGAGNDTIDSKAGNDELTGGAGNDTFKISLNSSTDIYSVITDAAKDDVIEFATDKGTETFTSAAVDLQDTANFQEFLDEAAKGDGSTNGIISWFVYQGNTYVTYDCTAGATFTVATDSVVRLQGVHDLSGAAIGDHLITLA